MLLGLPRQAHRYFTEPLSGGRHIKFLLFERFLKFVKSIESSEKRVLRKTIHTLKRECRSTTGRNMRNLMRLTGKTSVDDLVIGCTRGLVYNEIPDGEEWKVSFAKDLINMNFDLHGVSLTKPEIEEMMREVTT